MKNILTKRNVLVVSGILGGGTLLFSEFAKPSVVCGGRWECMDIIATVGPILLPFIPLFFFSLITYFLPDRVFRSWFSHFAIWWIPLWIFATLVAPNDGGGGWGIPTISSKAAIYLVSFILFIAISTIIIIVSFMRNRTKKGATL